MHCKLCIEKMNTFGHIFRLTTFGESHGPAIGGVIDGCPAGLHLDFAAIKRRVALRSPQTTVGSTKRRETDNIEFLSGIYEGVTLGTPIAFIIRNKDVRSETQNLLHRLVSLTYLYFSSKRLRHPLMTKYALSCPLFVYSSSAYNKSCRMGRFWLVLCCIKNF